MKILQRFCFGLLLLANMQSSRAQFPVHPDSVFTFMRYNAANRLSVDWITEQQRFRTCLTNAGSAADTMHCLVGVLESLQDVHSQLFLDNKLYGHYPSFPDSILPRLRELTQRSGQETNHIATAMLTKTIAYLRVPGFNAFGTEQVNAYAQALYDSLASLRKRNMRSIIIDLRLNGGGNLYPMLTGLSPLLGKNIVGYEVDPDAGETRTWETREGQFNLGNYTSAQIIFRKGFNLADMKVAVLIGPVTRSSGSMVAIAFKQRPHTIFIGEPTAEGYTTSNNYFQFAPNLVLNFATHYVADRNHNLYKVNVTPDIAVNGGDEFDKLTADKKIIAALHWLQQKK